MLGLGGAELRQHAAHLLSGRGRLQPLDLLGRQLGPEEGGDAHVWMSRETHD